MINVSKVCAGEHATCASAFDPDWPPVASSECLLLPTGLEGCDMSSVDFSMRVAVSTSSACGGWSEG